MRRREFISLVGGAAAWPVVARAQQPERMRRIGTLTNAEASDPEWMRQIAAFLEQLKAAGWVEGRNVSLDYRFAAGDANRMSAAAKELVGLKPAPSRLCSFRCPILSARTSPRAWRGPAETLPGSPMSKPRWEANGSNC
jgi:hypothetical protein